jgi:hypothetical protein
MNPRDLNKRAKLPALPMVSTQDASMKAWVQAVSERLEVREGQRGDSDERVLTQRDLLAITQETKPLSVGSSWIESYGSLEALGDALRGTRMHDDLLRRIANIAAQEPLPPGEYDYANETIATPVVPDALRLVRNDLDFYRFPTVTSKVQSTYQEFVCTVNTSGFYSQGGNHIAFAIDCSGAAGGGRPHYGPILRNGANLFELARGFIIFGDGVVLSEHWNGTFSPGLSDPLPNASGGAFSPANTPIFTVRVTAGYRLGAMANRMDMAIHRGGASGPIIFSSSVPWGWDWSGSHVAYFAAIASGFKSPNETGNVERVGSGIAPSATVSFSGGKVTIA